MKRTLYAAAAIIGLGSAAFMPTPALAQVGLNIIIGNAPPPPRFERMPHPRHGYVWAPGHWEGRGQRHDWVPGVWIVERPGYLYSPAGWVQRDGRWFMQEGRWAPRGGRGDRQDRYEHERYNGGGRERDHDGEREHHDRDGDGVPNRRDNHPDNPRRN